MDNVDSCCQVCGALFANFRNASLISTAARSQFTASGSSGVAGHVTFCVRRIYPLLIFLKTRENNRQISAEYVFVITFVTHYSADFLNIEHRREKLQSTALLEPTL